MVQKSWTLCFVLALVQFNLATNCSSWFECVGSFFKDFTSLTKFNISETSANGTVISVLDLGNGDVENVFEDFKSLPNAKKSYVNNKTDADILTFDLSKILDTPINIGFADKTIFGNNRKTSLDVKSDKYTTTELKNEATISTLIINNTEKGNMKPQRKIEIDLNITEKSKNSSKIMSQSNKIRNSNTTEINNNDLLNKTNIVNKLLVNETKKPIINETSSVIISNENKTIYNIPQNKENITLNSKLPKSTYNSLGNKPINITYENDMSKENQSLVNGNNINKNMLSSNTMVVNKNNNSPNNNTITFSFNIANLLQDELDVPGPSEDVKDIFSNFEKFTNFNGFKNDHNIASEVNSAPDFSNFFRDSNINPFQNNNKVTNYANIFENLGLINGPINSNANIIMTKTPTIIGTSEILIPTQNIKNENIEYNKAKNETYNNKNITLNDYFIDYYEDHNDDSTDYPIVDYVELYKDTTNEKVSYVSTERTNLLEQLLNTQEYEDNIVADASVVIENNANGIKKDSNATKPHVEASIQEKVFSWIVTIFLKNSTNNQFSYICDGALLSSRYILTAAQCVTSGNLTNISPLNLLVIAGKRSLQDFSAHEKAFKVIKISLHKNYTYNDGVATNDLAILQTEESVELNEFVQTCSALEDDVKEFHETVTTAWNGDGSLVPVALKLINCPKKNVLQKNMYCSTYENEVTGCPSYGGLHAVKLNKDGGWFLKGIYNGDISKRAPFCFQQIFTYTSINEYSDWITDSTKT